MAASIPGKNGTELQAIEETSKNESMPIAKRELNNTNSMNVSTQVSNPLEAKNDTVNATGKDASLKNVLTKIREEIPEDIPESSPEVEEEEDKAEEDEEGENEEEKDVEEEDEEEKDEEEEDEEEEGEEEEDEKEEDKEEEDEEEAENEDKNYLSRLKNLTTSRRQALAIDGDNNRVQRAAYRPGQTFCGMEKWNDKGFPCDEEVTLRNYGCRYYYAKWKRVCWKSVDYGVETLLGTYYYCHPTKENGGYVSCNKSQHDECLEAARLPCP